MKNKCTMNKKTLWENDKLCVTSNFSFSHNIFHSYIFSVHKNVALCCNGLTIVRRQISCLIESDEKEGHFSVQLKEMSEKQKLLVTSNSSFSLNVFINLDGFYFG